MNLRVHAQIWGLEIDLTIGSHPPEEVEAGARTRDAGPPPRRQPRVPGKAVR